MHDDNGDVWWSFRCIQSKGYNDDKLEEGKLNSRFSRSRGHESVTIFIRLEHVKHKLSHL
jgi:hypothetical protein